MKISAATKTVKAGKSLKLKANTTITGKSVNKVLAKKAGKGKTVTITDTFTDGSNKKATIKIKFNSVASANGGMENMLNPDCKDKDLKVLLPKKEEFFLKS